MWIALLITEQGATTVSFSPILRSNVVEGRKTLLSHPVCRRKPLIKLGHVPENRLLLWEFITNWKIKLHAIKVVQLKYYLRMYQIESSGIVSDIKCLALTGFSDFGTLFFHEIFKICTVLIE